LTVLTFLAGGLAVAGVYSIMSDLFLRERTQVSQRVDDEFSQSRRDLIRRSKLFKDPAKVKNDLSFAAGPTDYTRPGMSARFAAMVEQSGLPITPSQLLMVAAGVGVGLGLLIGLLWGNILAALGAGLAGATLPVFYVRFKQKKRVDKLMSQLPDAFDLMARVIRAGQTMGQAFQGVADEFQAPIATEFSYCYEQQNLGLSPEIALRDLARRTGLVEVSIFVMAVLVQRQTGGNLAELLEKLSGVVRERFRIKGKIRVLTAEGRLEAAVLLALPPLVFLLILFLNRRYAQGLLDHPNLIVGMLIMMGLGTLWIRKIINFDF
jgi:tight adherence protein B